MKFLWSFRIKVLSFKGQSVIIEEMIMKFAKIRFAGP